MNGNYSPILSSIREEQLFDVGGKAQTVVRVEYMVGTHGPFVERIPKEKFSTALVSELLTATATTVNALASTFGQK